MPQVLARKFPELYMNNITPIFAKATATEQTSTSTRGQRWGH